MIDEEQRIFKADYQSYVLEVIKLARFLETRIEEVKAQTVLKNDHTAQLAVRVAERDAQKLRLDAVTATAKIALQNLDLKVDELFQITKQLGDAQDALVGLEAKLHQLELGPRDEPKKEKAGEK